MKKISFVCIANYCRSPVAEVIFNNICTKDYEARSFGIAPIAKSDMDPRSRKFLDNLQFEKTIHTPTKINNKIINESDLILALDINVLRFLMRKYSVNKNKIKIINYLDHSFITSDPYRSDNDHYEMIMENIKSLITLIHKDL